MRLFGLLLALWAAFALALAARQGCGPPRPTLLTSPVEERPL